MEGSSAFQFVRVAYKAGLVSRRQLAADAWTNLVFRLRGSTDAAATELRERISRELRGVRVREMQRLGPDLLARILPRLYPQMLALAYDHQDAGRRTYIITAAAQELAEALARVLAFDGGIGSRYSQHRDGVFTGEPAGLFIYRAGKAQAVAELAQREGIDLESSYAYSDSESDLPMLRLVGHPVAVNPDPELARVARAEGWEVLRFERLGRRLKATAALAGAAAAGGIGTTALAARKTQPRKLSPQAAPVRHRGTRRPHRPTRRSR